jgi:hypothetical protein
VVPEFIIPAVKGMIFGLPKHDFAARHRLQFVLGSFSRFRADIPDGKLTYLLDGNPANDHRGGFQVDSLVFDPHHYGPAWIIPGDRHF